MLLRPVQPRLRGWAMTAIPDYFAADAYDEPAEPAPLAGFWSARMELETIHRFAQARRAAPWAVLGGVLARVVASTPRAAVLPPLIGSHASVNLFVGLVAPSGGGKGAALAAARDVFQPSLGVAFNTLSLGSGEGIAHAYVARVKNEDGHSELQQHTESVLFDVPEVDTLAAVGSRRGSTLLPELRKTWSGERLGFQNADAMRRLHVEPGAYRAALTVGIQPGRAGGLLDDTDGGTPQRFLWLPATDPTAPDVPPELPEPLEWVPGQHMIGDSYGDLTLGLRSPVVIDVCETARREVDARALARHRGEADALDGQATLAKLKVAAALALLDQRSRVNDEDWSLAGVVMEVSDTTRARVREYLADKARAKNRARAEADAERAVTVAERVASDEVERTCRYVLRQLGKSEGGMNRRRLMQAAGKRHREHLADALDLLTDAGHIVLQTLPGQGQPTTIYALRGEGLDVSETGRGWTLPTPASTPSKSAESSRSEGVDSRGWRRPTPRSAAARPTPVSDDTGRAS